MVKIPVNQNIEALRGFAALSVFIHHMMYFTEFNPGFSFYDDLLPYSTPGHLMVLVFFMLSGYVIGLTTPVKEEFSVAAYLRKRVVRIYPIYLVAVCLTAILFVTPWDRIIGTLLFVQNLLVDNMRYNMPLWSLNHEIVYYLVVIPIILCRVRPLCVLGVLFCALLVSSFIVPFPTFLIGYLVGFSFWMIGYWISWFPKETDTPSHELLSVFVLFLGYDYLNFFSAALYHLPLHQEKGKYLQYLMNMLDLGSLPVCGYAILVCTGSIKWLKQVLYYIVYGSSFAYVFYLGARGKLLHDPKLVLPTTFLFLSFVIGRLPSIRFSIQGWAWLGSISYAIYVIHTPIIYSIGRAEFCSGTTVAYFLRFLVCIVFVVCLAFLLEKKMQPWIKKKWMPK